MTNHAFLHWRIGFPALAATMLMLSGCAPAVPTATPTPDPCSPANVGPRIEDLHRLTREFDDASALATNTDIRNLYAPIADLQRIRREAEDQVVPACLQDLRNSQLAFMAKVVDTLMAFASGTADVNSLSQGMKDARGLRDQYNLNLAAAMGLPVTTGTPGAPPTAAP
jgi:hypothetical protein